MKRLIEWSVDHRWMVMVCSILLLAAGWWSARDMPIDVFPDLTAPTVTVLTEGQGMSPGRDGGARHVPHRDGGQRGVRGPAGPLSHRARDLGDMGGVRLGDRHLHCAADRRRETVAHCRVAPAPGRAADPRAHLVDHGRDPVLCRFVRYTGPHGPADDRRYRHSATPPRRPGRLPGHPYRRGREAVPNRRRPCPDASERRVDRSAHRRRRGSQQQHVSGRVRRGAAGVRARGHRPRQKRR